MKFKLIVDKNKDEEVVATVHNRTALIDEIEALLKGVRCKGATSCPDQLSKAIEEALQ